MADRGSGGEVNLLSVIERKRDGQALAAGEIRALVEAYTQGAVPDYQIAALLMAIYFRGMNGEETRALAAAMRDSGEVLKFSTVGGPVVDKHSTGGIGDKVSLPLAPLLACLGFRVPMISGRALGITGGTLDKLETIPGFRTNLTRQEIEARVENCGFAMAGQTAEICPADRLLYALRDVTATVPSIPLITASILSKKLAEGLSALVLDVKFGGAAFMQTRDQARELASTMIEIAGECGLKTRALITDMNSPLGRAAGNWLEVKESVECLENRGPEDLRTLVTACAAHLFLLTGRAEEYGQAVNRIELVLASGAPRRKWDEMVTGQGGDLAAFNERLSRDHHAAFVRELKAASDGWLARCDARLIGELVRDLGGGRLKKDSAVNGDVGVDCIAAIGEKVARGDVLCRIHALTEAQANTGLARLAGAFEVSPDPVPSRQLILDVI